MKWPSRLGSDLAPGRDGREGVAERAQPRARLGWFLLADDPAQLVEGRVAEHVLIERRRAGQQLVQEHTQRVDVAAGVDVHAREFDLLGAHVQRCAHELGEGRVDRLVGEALSGGLGNAEIDDLGHGGAVDDRNQDVRRFQVAVDDPLLVARAARPGRPGRKALAARGW